MYEKIKIKRQTKHFSSCTAALKTMSGFTVSDPDSKSFKKLLEIFQISLEKMQ